MCAYMSVYLHISAYVTIASFLQYHRISLLTPHSQLLALWLQSSLQELRWKIPREWSPRFASPRRYVCRYKDEISFLSIAHGIRSVSLAAKARRIRRYVWWGDHTTTYVWSMKCVSRSQSAVYSLLYTVYLDLILTVIYGNMGPLNQPAAPHSLEYHGIRLISVNHILYHRNLDLRFCDRSNLETVIPLRTSSCLNYGTY